MGDHPVLSGWALSAVSWALTRGGKREGEVVVTDEENSCGHRDRDQRDVATSQRGPAAIRSWTRHRRILPQSFQGGGQLCQCLISAQGNWFHTSGLQKCELSFSCFKPPNMWTFATAAPGSDCDALHQVGKWSRFIPGRRGFILWPTSWFPKAVPTLGDCPVALVQG